MAPRRIGQILVDLGFLTDEQLEIVFEEQEQQPGALFGRIAEEMQLITDDQLIQAARRADGNANRLSSKISSLTRSWKRSVRRWPSCIEWCR